MTSTPSRAADDLPPLPTLASGRYRHYKGGAYEVLGVVRHSETLAPMVLYRSLDGDGGLWVRPFAMFVETVPLEGGARPRFQREDIPPAAAGDHIRRSEP